MSVERIRTLPSSPLHIYRASLERSVLATQRPPREYFDDWPPRNFDTKSWLDVEKWINHVGFKSAETDSIFRKILYQMAVLDDSNRQQELFLFLAWQSLLRLNTNLRRFDPDEQERWANLVWGFIRTIHRFRLNQRPQNLGRKILNDTLSDLKGEYRKYYRFQKTARGEFPTHRLQNNPTKNTDSDAIINSTRRNAIAQLRTLVKSKDISAKDFDVLVSCNVYGRPLHEIAIKSNQKYGTVKRRRLRAEKKIKKYAPHLSPENPDSPLWGLRH